MIFVDSDYPWEVITLLIAYGIFTVATLIFRPTENNTFLFLLVDVCELFLFIYFTGGASNPFAWFLLIPILISATLLSLRKTWVITVISIILYALLYFTGTGHSMNHETHTDFNAHIIGMWIGFTVLAILMAWVISKLTADIQAQRHKLMLIEKQKAEDDKIIALGTLATGAAHELATPLASMQLLTDQLLDKINDDTQIKKINIIRQQIKRCKKSLTQITAATGTSQALQGSLINIDSFIKKINDSWSNNDCRLHIKKPDYGEQLIWCDKTLVQSIINLFNNAADAKASSIKLEISCLQDMWCIHIIDDGEGLQTPKFTQFSSRKDFGMGLGLYLTSATINRMHGHMSIHERKPAGTHIKIAIPKIEATTSTHHTPNEFESVISLNKKQSIHNE